MHLPTTYDEWRHCIEVKCRQPLTREYVAARITALRDGRDPHTRRFLECYGEAQWRLTIDWFERAARELA